MAIKASMNIGLSHKLKEEFTDVVPVVRSLVKNKKLKYPHRLAGFTAAEGCNFVAVSLRLDTGFSCIKLSTCLFYQL